MTAGCILDLDFTSVIWKGARWLSGRVVISYYQEVPDSKSSQCARAIWWGIYPHYLGIFILFVVHDKLLVPCFFFSYKQRHAFLALIIMTLGNHTFSTFLCVWLILKNKPTDFSLFHLFYPPPPPQRCYYTPWDTLLVVCLVKQAWNELHHTCVNSHQTEASYFRSSMLWSCRWEYIHFKKNNM